MDSYRNGNKRNYDQPKPKQQREKRKSKFNHYDNINLNTPVNFISSGNNQQSKNDDNISDESNSNRKSRLRNPSPPPPPIISNNNFEFNQHTPQLKGIGGKLLLQMGYEPGKGLGKNLQGIQVPIKAKPRLGRGAIGAYGPENINSLPIETIHKTVSNSKRYNNKFVADEINELYNDNDELMMIDLPETNINNNNNNDDDNTTINNEPNDDDDTLIKNLTNIVMALDDTNKITSTTPSIEHNEIIDDNSNEDNDFDILNINSTWKLSIISFDYPKLKLTGDQFEQIEYEIFNMLFDDTNNHNYNNNDNNFNEPIQFHKSELINGTMQFICANESTKNWLYNIIENNNNNILNIKLKIVETDTLKKYTQIKLWLCGPKLQSDIILKTLQKQNHNLKTDKWRVYNLNYFHNFNSTELMVGIDCISLAELKKLNLKPFYRCGRCTVHLSKSK